MIGSTEEKEAASAVMPIVKKHHLLLVTLLLFNSLANESLPIFLGALVPNYLAIIVSVTLILMVTFKLDLTSLLPPVVTLVFYPVR